MTRSIYTSYMASMADIVVLGLNHKTAPVELRECIAFSEEQSLEALKALREHPAIEESLIVFHLQPGGGPPGRPAKRPRPSKSQSASSPNTTRSPWTNLPMPSTSTRETRRCATFSGWPRASIPWWSGEPQILGQVKEAYRLANTNKSAGVILNRLLHRTFFVAKRIRHETGIGDHAVSISYAAIELGRKIFGSLEGKKVLLVGAGEMAELAVEHLIRHRAGQVLVANRTFARGVELAGRFNGTAVRFEEIPECLEQVDIIISSTGSPGFVIDRDQVKGVMRKRKNRPLFFIDIAVPRDIDPEINRLNNAYVYDIDDLKEVVEENIEDRQKEALKGERIVDEAVDPFPPVAGEPGGGADRGGHAPENGNHRRGRGEKNPPGPGSPVRQRPRGHRTK